MAPLRRASVEAMIRRIGLDFKTAGGAGSSR